MFFQFQKNRFIQSWHIKNNGDETWPYGCYLKSISCDNLPVTPVTSIAPGESVVIHVTLTSPKESGSFQTKWRLFTSNGSCFGGKFNDFSTSSIHIYTKIILITNFSHFRFFFCLFWCRYNLVHCSGRRGRYLSPNTTISPIENEQYEWSGYCSEANIWGMSHNIWMQIRSGFFFNIHTFFYFLWNRVRNLKSMIPICGDVDVHKYSNTENKREIYSLVCIQRNLK